MNPTISAPALLIALAIDVVFGELPNALHPVAWMGKVIELFEHFAPRRRRYRQLAYGMFMVVVIPAIFVVGAAAMLWAVNAEPMAQLGVHAFLLKSTFSVRGLAAAALRVRTDIRRASLEGARDGLRSLCSRDPTRLQKEDLLAGAIESVAENASDSIVAPLFFYVLFGLEGALVYRVVNTMDAMIGYHGRYEYLGKAAARLDDALNIVPARITVVFLLVAGLLAGGDVRRGLRVWARDARSTESPNAGHPMALMAGLLRVELSKPGHYRLGDPVHVVGDADLLRAVAIMIGASVLAAATAMTLVPR